MDIYVVRHGQTDYNINGLFQGNIDICLNEEGIKQAKRVANKFRNTDIDLIIASPLKRAIQTANYINEVVKTEIIIDERLKERCFGNMEGKVNREDWNIQMMLDYDKNYDNENIEPIQQFFNRIYNFLDDVKKIYINKRIILVTHGAVSQPIECYFNGMPKNKNYDGFEPLTLKNCEIRRYIDVL